MEEFVIVHDIISILTIMLQQYYDSLYIILNKLKAHNMISYWCQPWQYLFICHVNKQFKVLMIDIVSMLCLRIYRFWYWLGQTSSTLLLCRSVKDDTFTEIISDEVKPNENYISQDLKDNNNDEQFWYNLVHMREYITGCVIYTKTI